VIFKHYQLACLSLFSYLLGDESTGRAVVVDPQRDVAEYVADAHDLGLRIERVIETHVHADFLSGHLELAAATGAVISYGDALVGRTEFEIDPLSDGQRLVLGNVVLEIRATPGHTPESICVVIWEHAGDTEPYGVLTGDTLFIGDVGRPDLLVATGLSADALARRLYHSLHEQLLTLPDSTLVFPAHGAGSACGRSMSTAASSTIGEQRRTNYALAPMDEDAFVCVVTEGQPLSPAYFTYDASRNREARPLLDEENPPSPLSLDEVSGLQSMGAVVVDTRDAADFAAGHLRGSINVGLGGRFAEYAGDVVDPSQPIILVTEPGSEQEAKVRLARIGLDRIEGALGDPLAAFADHPDAVDGASRLTASELRQRLDALDGVQLVDVRNPNETDDGTLPGAALIPIARLTQRIGELDPTRPVVAYCASGYRSSAAASVLRAGGFTDVSDLLGGYAAWKQSETPSRP
jgi:glyoxylase-like metal-dependent hydrolase (beta-lactamase superfamily II)/rhodanese-related sulfurtransferase